MKSYLQKTLCTLLLAFACYTAPAVQAQPISLSYTQSRSAVQSMLVEAAVGKGYAPTLHAFNPTDPEDPIYPLNPVEMTPAQWMEFEKSTIRMLGSADVSLRDASLQNIIYSATFFADHADFQRAASELYSLYRLDRNEQRRIMALTALHAIGHEDTMRNMALDVRLERSPRVRRLTLAALADHWSVEAD